MDKRNLHQQFEDIYKEFAQGIFRFIYFKVSDYELAKDLTADTFIKFWKQLIKAQEIQNNKALLYFIAKGSIIDHYRKKKHKNISIEAIDERLLGVIDTIEDSISLKQEIEQIYQKLKMIKKEYQDVLLLRYVEDLTISEITNVLGKKENAVRVLLHRALKALKEKI